MTQYTQEQLAVIQANTNINAKIIAVAGAGKTTTLIARINHLIEQGVQPDRIAVFMFNKSAQEEFSQRLLQAMTHQSTALKPEVMTFHSFGMKLARRMEQRGLIERSELITDDFSLVKLMREAMQQLVRMQVNIELHDEKDWLEDAMLFVDQVKASTQSAKAVFLEAKWSKDRAFFPALYKQLEIIRKRKKIRFFSDLISDPLSFIEDANEEQKALYLGLVPKYTHLLIDEFQDINDSQYSLLKHLYQSHSYWMMVGDVQQCIYEWRGAKPDIMAKQIDHDFKPIHRFDLSTSFRFGHQIGLMASNLLAHNKQLDNETPEEESACVIGKGEQTEFSFAQYDKTGKALLNELKTWGNQVGNLSNCAVLVRLYSDMVPIQLALMHRKVPYQLHGDSPLFENRQIRMLMAYIGVMAGGLDDASLFYHKEDISYLMTVPSLGIPPNQRKTINQRAIASPHLIPQMLESMADETNGWRAKKLLERADWLRSLTLYSKQPDKGIINTLDKLGIYRYFENTSSKEIQYNEKVATCESFIAYVAGVKLDAKALLDELKQLASLDQSRENSKNQDSLHLMSLHKAKGLEFDLVIMAGLKEGLFPYYEANKLDATQLAAERRLFYVGITRAKKKLVLLTKPDKAEAKRLEVAEKAINTKKVSDISRFIYESQPLLCQKILQRQDDHQASNIEVKDTAKIKAYFAQAGMTLNNPLQQSQHEFSGKLKPGEKVRHDQFGQGVVIRQEKGGNEMIYVEFEEVGFKRFNPRHTKLVKLVNQ
ncbi:related to ATP-dependent DNA helicase II (Rep) [Marinomonas sp. MED121]|uniref:ATP-dependent helicase n=1 Tax=Marinomonas sp. MED121 TaxID=314277 RepID=UPI00006905BE|nr:ATP-dependent helicase [Marinomonas sp. MED121]EAQ63656.1 related to ATP-dependent DNA helicase II (Rep) [Marinomonas sp. MED121]